MKNKYKINNPVIYKNKQLFPRISSLPGRLPWAAETTQIAASLDVAPRQVVKANVHQPLGQAGQALVAHLANEPLQVSKVFPEEKLLTNEF